MSFTYFLYKARERSNNARIDDGDVGTSNIQDGSITSDKIINNAVINSKISDLSITTSKILDGEITEIKFQDASITGAKFEDNTITTDKFDDINLSKISSFSDFPRHLNDYAKFVDADFTLLVSITFLNISGQNIDFSGLEVYSSYRMENRGTLAKQNTSTVFSPESVESPQTFPITVNNGGFQTFYFKIINPHYEVNEVYDSSVIEQIKMWKIGLELKEVNGDGFNYYNFTTDSYLLSLVIHKQQ